MEGIEAYIDQLHTSDQGSYSFRYAVGKSGDATLGGSCISPSAWSASANTFRVLIPITATWQTWTPKVRRDE
jgi:hypothetical protein